jgi:hypothetical protein
MEMPSRDLPRRSEAWAALLLVLGAVPAWAGDSFSPLLKAHTVMITVSRGTGPETGSGVILCQEGEQAYILTARHVLYGQSLGYEAGLGLSDADIDIELRFYKDLAPPVHELHDGEETITKVQAGKSKDLLLLIAPLKRILPRAPSLAAAPSSAELGDRRERNPYPVYAIGARQGREETEGEGWAVEEGRLLQREGELLRHSTQITPGFSGGPLFNEAGAVVGINIETDLDPSAVMAEDQFSRALPIEEVIETINKWIPGSCLENADLVRDVAYSTYRQAMRAVSAKKWEEARRLMEEALEELPWEGGVVHLQGMRYTIYLPRYHLGLALYKAGRCDEALQEWARSEAQRAIRDDKRYRKMKRYRERCDARIQERLGIRTTAPKGE